MCSSFEQTHSHLCIMHRRERERDICKEEEHREKDICTEEEHMFGVLSLYFWYIYLEEVLLGFLPLEGFPGINMCLSCDFVSFNDPTYAIFVKLSLILMISS